MSKNLKNQNKVEMFYKTFLGNKNNLKKSNISSFLLTKINNPITHKDNIYNYIQSLKSNNPNLRKRGISVQNYQNNYYFFNTAKRKSNNENNSMLMQGTTIQQMEISNISQGKNIYKLLQMFFKSIYCIISKPVFVITPDKIVIKLFYFLNIPTYKVYSLFAIFYYNKIKNIFKTLKNKTRKTYRYNRFFSNYLFIRNRYLSRKLVKSILKLKSKILTKTKKEEKRYLIFRLFKKHLNNVFKQKFIIICNILSNKFNKPVELHLTRLHQPYSNSNILVNLLAMNLKNKKNKSRVLIKKIFKKSSISSVIKTNTLSRENNWKNQLINSNVSHSGKPNAFISGLNIKIAGRLMREPIIPRLTTKNFESGIRATGKVNFLDTSSITKKNKKGAFTIKIVSAQNFNN
jgi:hypothetical protein